MMNQETQTYSGLIQPWKKSWRTQQRFSADLVQPWKCNDDEQKPPPTPETKRSRNYSFIIALSPLFSIFVGISFMNVLAPLILWLIWKDRHPRIDKVGKSVLIAQLSWCLWPIFILIGILIVYAPIALLISFAASSGELLRASFVAAVFIYICIAIILIACWFIFSIIHAIKIADGNDDYLMPFTMRFPR